MPHYKPGKPAPLLYARVSLPGSWHGILSALSAQVAEPLPIVKSTDTSLSSVHNALLVRSIMITGGGEKAF